MRIELQHIAFVSVWTKTNWFQPWPLRKKNTIWFKIESSNHKQNLFFTKTHFLVSIILAFDKMKAHKVTAFYDKSWIRKKKKKITSFKTHFLYCVLYSKSLVAKMKSHARIKRSHLLGRRPCNSAHYLNNTRVWRIPWIPWPLLLAQY